MLGRFAALLFAVVLTTPGLAQQIVLSGTVSATDGAPLRGVSVHLVDTQLRAVTDTNGRYSLAVPANGVLAFMLAGRRPTQQQVLARSTIDVTMEPDRLYWRALKPGWSVRVAAREKTYEGSFVQISGERLVLETPAAKDSIPITHVGAMWQNVPAIEPGARIGGLVGALSVGVIAYQQSKGACLLNSLCGPGARVTYVAFSSFLGAAGGAVLGAAIGRSFGIWQRVPR